jgi:AcrR family transcriptional regulator
MAQEVDTVNMLARDSLRPYHHGRLRKTLVDAGLRLARTGGPEAVGLRTATRVAGVSHNAAYRHFAHRDNLLRAVCERCMSKLATLIEQRMKQVAAPDPVTAAWARLSALGTAYMEFATAEPGWFRTAFAVPRTVHSFAPGEGVGASGLNAHELLGARLDELVAVGAIPCERRPGLEYAAWSAMHGLSILLNEGALQDLPSTDRERARHTVLDFIGRGL